MPEQPPDAVNITKLSLMGKIVLILLAGTLSMVFGEVFSGSSVLWFATSSAWIVTFWLYLAHLLLFVNLAFIFKRTSLTSLYMWGVFFGLYESWITKVIWAGYMGSTPASSTFLGFAINEFPLIAFFWHPIMSFIVPVLTFEVLSGESRILPEHLSILTKSRRNWLLALMVAVIGGSFLAFGSKGSFLVADVTILGSVILIAALCRIAKKSYAAHFSIESLKLGKAGMAILLAYMALLYVIAFFFMLPERIAPPLTILLTLGVYVFIAVLLYLNKRDRPSIVGPGPEKETFKPKDIAPIFAVFFILATIFSILTPVDNVMVFILYIILYVASPVLLIMAIMNVMRRRKNAAGA